MEKVRSCFIKNTNTDYIRPTFHFEKLIRYPRGSNMGKAQISIRQKNLKRIA